MNLAVHLDLGTTQCPELETDEKFAISLRNWCGLLVSFNDNKIHLLHQTTREFLIQKGFADANNQTQPITHVESHSVLAISCITSVHSVSEPLSDFRRWWWLLKKLSLKDNQRFLFYSSHNWFHHVHDAGLEKELSLVPKIKKNLRSKHRCFPILGPLLRKYERTSRGTGCKRCQHALDSSIYWNDRGRHQTA